jgi:IS5 family transposase
VQQIDEIGIQIQDDPATNLVAKSRGLKSAGVSTKSKQAKTRRSKDGTWAKKGDEWHFGNKLHENADMQYGLIRANETTTTSVHDSQVDLSREGEAASRTKTALEHLLEAIP